MRNESFDLLAHQEGLNCQGINGHTKNLKIAMIVQKMKISTTIDKGSQT
jgi:hypothetical protein